MSDRQNRPRGPRGRRLTPMMAQYHRIKKEHPDAILFFRLGDFYEMFYEDAEEASRLLELTLTARTNRDEKIPMCGVPHHAAAGYIRRLLEHGRRVAICDQVEDPRTARGLVERKVVRVLTPGTVLEPDFLQESRHNYIAALAVHRSDGGPGGSGSTGTSPSGAVFGLAYADVSTGTFRVTRAPLGSHHHILNDLARLKPAECLISREARDMWPGARAFLLSNAGCEPITPDLPPAPREPEGRGPGAVEGGIAGSADRSTEGDEGQAASAGAPVPIPVLPDLLESSRPGEPEGAPEAPSHHRGGGGTAGGESAGGLPARAAGLMDHMENLPPGAAEAALLLAEYILRTQFRLDHLQPPAYYRIDDGMVLDASTRRNLELTERIADGSRRGTLLSVLDHTATAMGGRRLRSWIDRPLTDGHAIEERLDGVEAFVSHPFVRHEGEEILKNVYDLERLATRAAHGSATPRDMVALARSLEALPALAECLKSSGDMALEQLVAALDPVEEAARLISAALADEPPAGTDETGIIRDGYDSRIDELRRAARKGKQWIAALEQSERRATGIKSLKVGFNRVFGYYIEVTNPNRHLVPEHYERKQTLANSERYITPELKEKEDLILGAEERLLAMEQEVFRRVRGEAARYAPRIHGAAGLVARIDALMSLAEAADRNGYVRPVIDGSLTIKITAGRHPVLEQTLTDPFVPNDVAMDAENRRVLLVTGPNMAGKSTYLRQAALLVLMAQMGSFVPADEARIGLVDRIFCRVGAADDLAQGHSTFMVEILEALQVLQHGTDRSLAIIDELGRGTSTYDGIAIATAYLEYIYEKIGCRTLLSTHYFELTRLADRLPAVVNCHVGALLEGDGLTFLYHVQPGAADRSYGVEVAKMAGMPPSVIERAQTVLRQLEAGAGGEQRDPAEGPGAAEETAAAGSHPSDGRGLPAGTPGGASDEGGDGGEKAKAGTRSEGAGDKAKAGRKTGDAGEKAARLAERLTDVDVMSMTPLQAIALLDELAREARRITKEEHI